MIDVELLKILCCPETHQSLQPAHPTMMQHLNERIRAGQLHARGGKPVTQPCDAGLVREDGQFLYPVRHNIPILLIDEALPLAGLPSSPSPTT